MPLGTSLGVGTRRAGLRGPELNPGFTGSNWTLVLSGGAAGTVTQDTGGIHFIGANNVAAAFVTVAALKDNTSYEVSFTVSNFTGGGVKLFVYGATTLHSASTNTQSANGVVTAILNTSGGGSLTQQIRLQVTGTNGTNSLDVTAVSVKEVLS